MYYILPISYCPDQPMTNMYLTYEQLVQAQYLYMIDNFIPYSLPTEKLLVEPDAGLFFFINQGCLTVDSIDDQEEMDIMDVCKDT